jgi:menaquinone-dependent protoporphyrinogen oxidase
MRVLVVYGTGSGCTTGIAERIGQRWSAQGATVDVVPAEKAPAPVGYDVVIVGSGVRAGSWHASAKKWFEANAEALRSLPVALFTVGLTPAGDSSKTAEVVRYTDAMLASTAVEPLDVAAFAGWNEPKKFAFVERTILKMMKAPIGDFRDMDAVDRWTDAIIAKATGA